MRTNLPPHVSEAGVSLDAMSFADRLVERHLAGTASVEDLLYAEIDAPTIMRAILLARRASARAPSNRALAARCEALEELYRVLRVASFDAPDGSAGPAARSATMLSRENEVIELVRANGGYRTWETLPGRLPTHDPRLIRDRVKDCKMLAIGTDLRTAIYPSAQFLPSGHVVLGFRKWRRRLERSIGFPDRLSFHAGPRNPRLLADRFSARRRESATWWRSRGTGSECVSSPKYCGGMAPLASHRACHCHCQWRLSPAEGSE